MYDKPMPNFALDPVYTAEELIHKSISNIVWAIEDGEYHIALKYCHRLHKNVDTLHRVLDFAVKTYDARSKVFNAKELAEIDKTLKEKYGLAKP